MNKQVAAYWPGFLGLQASEKSGVVEDTKKVIDMSAMDIGIVSP